MDTSFLENLKEWREEHNLSQKKLSDMAGISLTTLRLFEMNKQKPQERTLSRLVNVVRHINEGTAPPMEEAVAPRRRGPGRRKKAKAVGTVAAIPKPVPAPPVEEPEVKKAPAPVVAKPAPVAPPVTAPIPAAVPTVAAPIPAAVPPVTVPIPPAVPTVTVPIPAAVPPVTVPIPAVVPPVTVPIPAAAPPVTVAIPSAAPAPTGLPLRLSNLDLELIGRILNMSDKEKVTLLATLIK